LVIEKSFEFPTVSIVIINWNGADDTIECVESLRKIDYPRYNIFIVDNGSSPSDVKVLREALDKHCRIIELKKNLGFAIANNIGIMIAIQNGAQSVLLLNNDTIVDKNFLKELLLASGKDQRIGILGPKMYFYEKRDRLWYAGGKLNMYLGHKQEGLSKLEIGQFNSVKRTDFVSGACMLIKKDIFNTVGLLPREYFLGWEDIDFCVAAQRSGYSCLFVPTSIIWHKASVSYKRHNLGYIQVFLGFRNRIIMRFKFLSFPKFCLFLLIQMTSIIPIHIIYYLVIYKDPKRIKSMFKGILAGFKEMRKRKILYSISSNNA
jgi:GT2 family glycosyltransferase